MSGKERPNLGVVAGGFIEAAGATSSAEYIYLEKITYYQKMCKRYGYRLQYIMVYGGSDFYTHHEIGRDTRLKLARMDIPAVVAAPRIQFDKIAVRPFNIGLDSDLKNITEKIQAVYASDMKELDLGVEYLKVKPLMIMSAI
jgi:hypothetical protein